VTAEPSREAKTVNLWILAAIGGAILLAHLLASLDYSNWTWGFNQYFFLGRAWMLALLAAACLLCLPPVWTRIVGLSRAGQRGGRGRRRLQDLLIASVLAAVFWIFRSAYQFLGDGRLMSRMLEQGNWFRPTELLDRWLHHVVLEATRRLWNWNAVTVHAALSVAAGFVFVLLALRLGGLLRHRMFVAGALLSLGLVQLFFGYVETYSLATAAMLFYIVLAIEYLAGRRRLAWVGACLLVGVALHNVLLFLVPSFLYLIAAKRVRPAERPGSRTFEGIVFLAAILGLALITYTAAHSKAGPKPLMLLPLLRDPVGQYTLLSWRHFVDFLNEQVLISPAGWIAAAALAVALWKDQALRRSQRYRFLAIAAAFPLVFNLVVRPDLGGSRDWDLWSMGSLPYLVAAVCWIAAGLGKRQEFKYGAYLMVVVGLFHVVPWIAVNSNPELNLDRFSRIADNNPLWPNIRVAAAQSELGHFYIEQDMNSEAVRHLERAVAMDPGTGRYWDALGVAYIGSKRFQEAQAPLLRAIDLDSRDATAYNNLGRAYFMLGKLDEAETVLRRSLTLQPGSGPVYYNLGQIYDARGEPDRALEAYGEAVRVWPFVPDYWQALAITLERLGRTSEAAVARQRLAELQKSGTQH
jgi:tetratricopeptide (TPR) repeat protein